MAARQSERDLDVATAAAAASKAAAVQKLRTFRVRRHRRYTERGQLDRE